MLGWPNHPIDGSRPPCLAWGGSATPRPACLRAAKPPPVAQGVVQPPLGPNAQKQNFERLAQGGSNHPLGQTLKFPFGPRGGRTILWATGGGSIAPKRPVWVWANHPGPTQGGRPPLKPPQHIFLDFFFYKKKM
jgi:hypothetical protein